MLKPHEDTSHERFWRQILRWLSVDAPAPMEILLARNEFSTGDAVEVRARVCDQTFGPAANETVWLKVTDPDAAVQDLQMQADLSKAGDYVAAFKALKPGVYSMEVTSSSDAHQNGYASTSILAADSLYEMRDAALNSNLLSKIAQTGGGNFYHAGNAADLVKNLESNRKIQTVSTRLDVWDMPIVFFLLFAFWGLEWLLRRRKGLS